MDISFTDQICTYIQNVLGTFLALFVVRAFIVYLRVHKKKKDVSRYRVTAKLMIVLGSGGHTHEILQLMKTVNHQIQPRVYVLADTDILSERKARKFEEIKNAKNEYEPTEFVFEKIPRSREVGQSWITAMFSTFKAFLTSLCVLYKHMPDTILCNGPGTCVPICLAAILIHILGLKHILIIYVESMCRVKTLSFTGRILYFIADYFFVNWPELKRLYPRANHVRLF